MCSRPDECQDHARGSSPVPCREQLVLALLPGETTEHEGDRLAGAEPQRGPRRRPLVGSRGAEVVEVERDAERVPGEVDPELATSIELVLDVADQQGGAAGAAPLEGAHQPGQDRTGEQPVRPRVRVVDHRDAGGTGHTTGLPAEESGEEGVQVDDVGSELRHHAPQLTDRTGVGLRPAAHQGPRVTDDAGAEGGVASRGEQVDLVPGAHLLGREVPHDRDHAAPRHLADVQDPQRSRLRVVHTDAPSNRASRSCDQPARSGVGDGEPTRSATYLWLTASRYDAMTTSASRSA